jgi:membrane protease YdiL (CAAX protease family)
MALQVIKPPLIKQGWIRAIALFVVYYALLLLTSFLASRGKDPNQTSSTSNILILFLGSVIGIALVIAFYKFIEHKPFKVQEYFPPSNKIDALVGSVLGIAILGAGTIILFFHGNIDWSGVSFKVADIFTGLILMIVIAFAEELVFRGYILANLLQSYQKWIALAASAVLFAAMHGANPGISGLALVNLLLGGFLLGINYLYTRSLWFCVALHFAWNFVQGPILGYAVSGIGLKSVLETDITGDKMFTGGSFGFEGSIVASGLILMAVLALYLVYERKYETQTTIPLK